MNKNIKWLTAAGVIVICAVGYTFWQKEAKTVMNETPVAVQNQEAAQKIVTVEGVTEYRLPNGLRVLLFPDLCLCDIQPLAV